MWLTAYKVPEHLHPGGATTAVAWPARSTQARRPTRPVAGSTDSPRQPDAAIYGAPAGATGGDRHHAAHRHPSLSIGATCWSSTHGSAFCRAGVARAAGRAERRKTRREWNARRKDAKRVGYRLADRFSACTRARRPRLVVSPLSRSRSRSASPSRFFSRAVLPTRNARAHRTTPRAATASGDGRGGRTWSPRRRHEPDDAARAARWSALVMLLFAPCPDVPVSVAQCVYRAAPPTPRAAKRSRPRRAWASVRQPDRSTPTRIGLTPRASRLCLVGVGRSLTRGPPSAPVTIL